MATKRSELVPLLILAVMWVTAGAAYGQVLHGCDRTGQLFSVNCATGAGTFLCTLPISATEIEHSTITGRAWVQAIDGAFTGMEYFPAGCVPAGPVTFDAASFTGLEYVGGILYGTSIPSPCSDATLQILNPATGVAMPIGPSLTGRPITGLAYDVTTNTMYGVTGCGVLGPSNLVTVNLATGQATVIGNTGVRLGSLEFCGSTLLAGGDNADGGNIYTINTATGAATLLGPSGFQSVTGLTLVDALIAVLPSTWGNVKRLYE